MSNTTGTASIEPRLTRAYVSLFLALASLSGTRMVSVARFGNYEVRLVELSRASSADVSPLWVELYAHDIQQCIDSCSCNEIEDAVDAAEHLISLAAQLNAGSRHSRMKIGRTVTLN